MSEEKIDDRDRLPNEEYQYGFHDEIESVVAFDKGLNEEVVREISRLKNEPEWMLKYA
ncbi:hypothetical protein [Erysipelothrix piscisicarius]|uniref:hypothetical protein n=1 Tax=Erysipelothrix piscisicarius TaxID=2485784 RepID=UPI001E4D0E2F|nr:hypothetical protein [Erysipelothrix piscisicarius]